MHVFITGGAGFIGSHLAQYHLAKGDRVHVVDDLSTGAKSNIAPFIGNPDFHFDEADILSWSGLEKAAAWADRIYHMAAVVGIYRVLAEPIKTMATNVAGCERLLRAIHAGSWTPQIILASSSEVYGSPGHGSFREDGELVIRSGAQSRWNYAISKLADEALGLSYARKYGLHITVIRLFNTIGPRQTGRYGMVVPRFIDQAVHNQPLTLFGDGTQTRSFCDVRDTIVALDELAGIPESAGEIVNVGSDREISIIALAEMIRERAGSTSPIEYVSYLKAYGEGFEDLPHRRPVLEKLYRLTRFRPHWSLENTVDDLIRLARSQHNSTSGAA